MGNNDPIRRSLVSQCARYAVALQGLALLACLVWGDEIGIHGGSAPTAVIVAVLSLQLPGLLAVPAFEWITDIFPHALEDAILFLVIAAASAVVWAAAFAALGFAWRGVRRLAAARS